MDKAAFFAIDAEFTGICHEKNITNFDTLPEFYKKTVATIDGFITIQIGLTAFRLNPNDRTKFIYKSYNFYVVPQAQCQRFKCQGSSMQFLAEHNFDFNKLFRYGISYCDRAEASTLKDKLNEKIKCLLTGSKECYGDDAIVPEEQKPFLKDVR